MRVVVAHHNPVSCERWRDALTRELPEAEVVISQRGDCGEASYAIAWAAPPPAFFAQQPRLKAFFSTGAGVEKLVDSPALPAHLAVIRLEDAGMAAQMAHHCVGEALRWVRHQDTYAEQQRDSMWRQLPREDLQDWPIGVFGFGVLGQRVASTFADLGFTVSACARSAHSDAGIRCFAETGGAGDFAAFLRAT